VQYRVPFVYYMAGRAEMRDSDTEEEQRAVIFLQKFTADLAGR
jgi:hypothetical protein